MSGILDSMKDPEKKKQAIEPTSLRGLTKLVMISAKKKCLNLTIPKGLITIFQRTIKSSFLALR